MYQEDITFEFDRLVNDAQLLEFGSQELPGEPVKPLAESPKGLSTLDWAVVGAIVAVAVTVFVLALI